MENFLKLISVIIICFLSLNFSGQDCHTTFELGNPTQVGFYQSKHGAVLPTIGTIRVLMIFAEIEFDVGLDPNQYPTAGWPLESLPSWKDELFDPIVLTNGQYVGENKIFL